MFSFQFCLTDEDYYRFNAYHALHSPLGKKSMSMFRWLMPSLCMAFLLVFWMAEAEPGLIVTEAAVLTLLSVLWILFSQRILLAFIRRNIRRMEKTGKLPYSQQVGMVFGEESFCETTPDITTTVQYSRIEGIYDTENAVYVYISAIQAYLIPSSAFSDAGEKQRFLDFLRAKAPRKG